MLNNTKRGLDKINDMCYIGHNHEIHQKTVHFLDTDYFS